MNEQEQAFWDWWAKVKNYRHLYSLKMAFDAGYEAREKDEKK